MVVRKKWWIINVLAFLFALLQSNSYNTAPITKLEYNLSDIWFHLRGELKAPGEVVIAAIDDQSLQRLGLSPLQAWPREKHVEFLERARDAGAKVVIFDLLFQGQGSSTENDDAFARALSFLPTVIASDKAMLGASDQSSTADLSPLEIFSENAKAQGNFINTSDFGIMRRFRMPVSYPKQPLRSLSRVAADLYGELKHGYPEEQDLVNYYGPAGTINVIPYYRLLDSSDEIIRSLKGKAVFVGSYRKTNSPALSVEDSFFTPYYQTRTFGVEIHATMAANIIRGDWIRRYSNDDERLALAVAVFFLSFVMFSMKPFWSSLLLVAAAIGWATSSYLFFIHDRFLPGLSTAILVLPLVFLSSTLYYYIVGYISQKRIRRAFSCYLSPEMVSSIAESEKKPELGGELKDVTILFSDIAGFTGWVEKNPPQEVCEKANRYFTEVVKPVLDSRGTLIKFIGDGIFVIWGAPIVIDNPSDSAVRSALEIQERIADLARFHDFPIFHTRIGIHRGPVVVGNFGSLQRFDYTALGDAVNVASRLEQINKRFGTSIIMSESVVRDLKERFDLVSLGKVRLAGKEIPLAISTIFDTPFDKRLLEKWLRALEAFGEEKWEEALELFEGISGECPPLIDPCALYRHYLLRYRETNLPKHWNGELIFDAK